MSATSRAKAAARDAERADQQIEARYTDQQRKLSEWFAQQGITPEQRTLMTESAAAQFDTEKAANPPHEPIPHWVLPIGESLVDPDYFYPPTAILNGKPSPVLSVRAFHHSLTPILGVTFDRVALGAPWVRTA